jgi:hypothetical protein
MLCPGKLSWVDWFQRNHQPILNVLVVTDSLCGLWLTFHVSAGCILWKLTSNLPHSEFVWCLKPRTLAIVYHNQCRVSAAHWNCLVQHSLLSTVWESRACLLVPWMHLSFPLATQNDLFSKCHGAFWTRLLESALRRLVTTCRSIIFSIACCVIKG